LLSACELLLDELLAEDLAEGAVGLRDAALPASCCSFWPWSALP
jgi:hypothetical protein